MSSHYLEECTPYVLFLSRNCSNLILWILIASQSSNCCRVETSCTIYRITMSIVREYLQSWEQKETEHRQRQCKNPHIMNYHHLEGEGGNDPIWDHLEQIVAKMLRIVICWNKKKHTLRERRQVTCHKNL